MKKIGGAVYFHKSVEYKGDERVREVASLLPPGFVYDVIKVTHDAVTFISSPNFDTANEPDVGLAWRISNSGIVKRIKSSGKVYHHKWMFVEPNYTGFDVELAKKRSETWENAMNLTKSDRSRIGNKAFWLGILEKHGLNP